MTVYHWPMIALTLVILPSSQHRRCGRTLTYDKSIFDHIVWRKEGVVVASIISLPLWRSGYARDMRESTPAEALLAVLQPRCFLFLHP
ncbi:hypothetical protein EX30DRAFT_179833 [Ascodesmis nigricans]|uniref:Secreted protein n=1 Tax=Ascodesmis nigricans TaxID=341454 RepID=A0A4S2MKZ0_9PEZI|nr:hypothetical protein EX30DRAFT_179833 [Ascodesmis nigricans]